MLNAQETVFVFIASPPCLTIVYGSLYIYQIPMDFIIPCFFTMVIFIFHPHEEHCKDERMALY